MNKKCHAISAKGYTFCIWRKKEDKEWNVGNINFNNFRTNDPDGSESLIFVLDGNPETYKEWAESYFDFENEKENFLEAIKYIYEHKPLNQKIINILNPDITLDELKEDIEGIAY